MRALAVLVLAGCIEPQLTPCGDLSCAKGEVCVEAAHGCYSPDRVDACGDLDEGAPCQTTDIPTGTCENTICVPAGCGDGLVEVGEECDGSVGDTSCLDRGFYTPSGLACSADCRFDTGACGGGYCGDMIVNGPEICDGASPAKESGSSLGAADERGGGWGGVGRRERG